MALGLLFALAMSGLAGQPAGDFLPEAEAAWLRYEKSARNLQGSVTSTFYAFDEHGARTVRRIVKAEYKQSGGKALRSMVIVKDAGENNGNRGSANVVTGSGAFRLTRKEADLPWVLTHYSPDSPDPQWLGSADPRRDVLRQTQAGLYFEGEFLPDLLHKSDFSFTTATREQQEGKELIRLDFTFQPRDNTQVPFRGGWIRVDPARSWLLHDFEFEGHWGDGKGYRQATFEYITGPSGAPIIKRVHEIGHLPAASDGKRTPIFEMEMDFDLHEQESVPAQEFSLSAFGLPEPTHSRQWPTYWFLVAAGVGCLVLALVFRWRSRRVAAA